MYSRFTIGLRSALFTAAALILSSSDCLAGGQLVSSRAVVELFTSQGCSSCPPADALLGELARRPDVIALAFHVDYWDSSSWYDHFSMPEATERQRRYVEALRLSTAFTPQMVVNGRASYVGSDKRRILAALSGPLDVAQIKLDIADGDLTVQLPQATDRRRFDVNLVGYLTEASTPVNGGENSGRSLHEFNIVRTLSRLGSWEGQAKEFSVPLSSLPPDANRIAIIVQLPDQGYVVAAAACAIR
jgi:hypothetical protein